MPTKLEPVRIDGSHGEGGGQILRTSLTLSAITGRAVRVHNIRAGRKKPGLLRQHATALKAIARITNATVDGDSLGSQTIELRPQAIQPGYYELSIGSAGSTLLVLQTVLPALMTAAGPSTLVLKGGTHNPWAPPFEFIERSYAPLLERMGVGLELELHREGFHPAGGGHLTAIVAPAKKLRPLRLLDRGAERARRAEAIVAHLSESIAERELAVLDKRLDLHDGATSVRKLDDSLGPGNAVIVTIDFESHTEVFSAIGQKNLRAEHVARGVADDVQRYLAAGAPIGEHLADQLLLPCALAGAGAFRAGTLSSHARTNLEVIRRFLEVPIEVDVNEQKSTSTLRFG